MCYISGTRQTLCRVHYWAHGKIKCTGVTPLNSLFAVCRNGSAHSKHSSFAVCPVMAHGKEWWHTAKLIFRFIFFCLITNISYSNQINITSNSYILHQMSRSFHISQFASHSIHRSPNANIANIAMHTSPNVVDTSPYKHW